MSLTRALAAAACAGSGSRPEQVGALYPLVLETPARRRQRQLAGAYWGACLVALQRAALSCCPSAEPVSRTTGPGLTERPVARPSAPLSLWECACPLCLPARKSRERCTEKHERTFALFPAVLCGCKQRPAAWRCALRERSVLLVGFRALRGRGRSSTARRGPLPSRARQSRQGQPQRRSAPLPTRNAFLEPGRGRIFRRRCSKTSSSPFGTAKSAC